MNELEKLLATRRDARVALIGPQAVVSKYIGETEKNIAAALADPERGGTILFFDEADDLFGKREEVEEHDGPVVLGARSLDAIPSDLRQNLVVLRAPGQRRWLGHLRRRD